MKRITLLVTLLVLLSNFTYGDVQVAPDANNDLFYAENYQIREVPQFYVDQYDIEKPFLAVGYVSGNIKDGLPQGYGNLNIFDYNLDGSLKRKMKFLGTFEDGMLLGEGQVIFSYEDEKAELGLREATGNFYYGLLHGEASVIMRGFNSETNKAESIAYTGNYKFGDREGAFIESIGIDGQYTKTQGNFDNDVKIGEWTPVVEEAKISN